MILKEVEKRRFSLSECVFDSEAVYKIARKAGEDLRYTFVEKEQSLKPEKYGHERKFEFKYEKKLDAFGKGEITVEIKFENLNKVKREGKQLDKGDVDLTLTANVILDYKNEWWMRKLRRSLLDFYLKYFVKERIERMYLDPVKQNADEIYGAIKDAFEE